jgi:hypothetical protein
VVGSVNECNSAPYLIHALNISLFSTMCHFIALSEHEEEECEKRILEESP